MYVTPDRHRQEPVLVVPAWPPCEDGDHVPAGDVVPALAGARRRLTVRESFTEIASDIMPTWSPIPVSASLTVHRVPVLNICAPILVRLVDPADRVRVAGVEDKEVAHLEILANARDGLNGQLHRRTSTELTELG